MVIKTCALRKAAGCEVLVTMEKISRDVNSDCWVASEFLSERDSWKPGCA